MEFVAKRKTLRITIEGESVEIKSPTLFDFDKLSKSIKGLEGEEVTSAYVSWFSELGIPERLIHALDQESFLDLVTFLQTPSKKK